MGSVLKGQVDAKKTSRCRRVLAESELLGLLSTISMQRNSLVVTEVVVSGTQCSSGRNLTFVVVDVFYSSPGCEATSARRRFGVVVMSFTRENKISFVCLT